MRGFEPITLSVARLRAELEEFEAFLNSATQLKEREQIAPFFKQRKHLVAALGYTHAGIGHPNRVSTELSLFGDFTCDAASGDSDAKAFLLIEFENAEPNSVLEQAPPGKVRPWSRRFEHGFSQLVDWAWRLSGEHNSAAFRRIFRVNNPSIHFLLIAGRDADLDEDDQDRVHWRAENITFGGYRMSCLTFDGALNTLRRRLLLVEQR